MTWCGNMNFQDSESRSETVSLDPRESLHSGLYNGRLLVALPYTSRAERMEQCLRKLQNFGIQVPLEQCRDCLQVTALIPELRRYIFFSSRGFGMILALILYISIWINLYSTTQMFSGSQNWVFSIPITLAAAAVTAAVILVINRHHKRINMNTDVRLAVANEIFMEHNVLLGISDRSRKCHMVPSLCFIYFHLSGCQHRLSQHLASMSKEDIRQCLDHLFIIIETPADPELTQGRPAEPTAEDTPLLPDRTREKPILCSKKVPLIHENEPQLEMARQLLVVSSACYVRLLITGLLPHGSETGHTGLINVPCPCQFIESTILQPGRCSMWI
ncbi:transmembrane protein 268 [Xenopus laevis]|uniref:Transmembrane protein 268 n=2 Tax=Xenopus laevis TaxID=8355 RepID=A0A1L8F1N7_XENLA|nr:transmembrane protein 268 [Xenopus laevis]XP_041430937.1 transmembrane protein 268 [Xenopus laevis]OCT65526.1 hypothetical protein XELAEV_18041764mg [Xenopus laevis]